MPNPKDIVASFKKQSTPGNAVPLYQKLRKMQKPANELEDLFDSISAGEVGLMEEGTQSREHWDRMTQSIYDIKEGIKGFLGRLEDEYGPSIRGGTIES